MYLWDPNSVLSFYKCENQGTEQVTNLIKSKQELLPRSRNQDNF